MKTFVDCHCHLFNIVDIPLYLTLTDKVNMKTLQRFKTTAGALMYSPLILLKKDLFNNKLDEYKQFIQFFERSIERNIIYLTEDIKNFISVMELPSADAQILITPLIMDFDYLLKEEKSEQIGQKPSVKEQYKRHTDAILSQNIDNVKICPFIGFDLRKLLLTDKDRLTNFKTFWNENNTLGVNDVSQLESGKLLGIKLYPPLGFNPSPDRLSQVYKNFYEWCCTEDIPITTHCQKASYSLGKEKRNLDDNTSPENWERLLEYPEFKNLRINFAHFGGETGTDDMFEAFNIFNPIDKDSWTYIIIQLLKEYPNTYADISAYDYSTKEHRNNLLKIFEMDDKNKFGLGYKLSDKLLWGSDVPMVISDKSYKDGTKMDGESSYKHYIGSFISMIKSSEYFSETQQNEIISNLIEKNPLQFLRIG